MRLDLDVQLRSLGPVAFQLILEWLSGRLVAHHVVLYLKVHGT